MSATNFELSASSLNCSYNSPEKDLFTCFMEDANGIQKKANNVSFLHVEPNDNYRSFSYNYPIGDSGLKIPVLNYEFFTPLTCRVQGTDKSTTIFRNK